MKKKILFLFTAAALCLSGCYDDSELRERMETLEETTVAGINAQLKNIRESVNSLEGLTSSLDGFIKALDESSTEMKGDISSLKASRDTLDAQVKDLKSYLDGELSDMKDWAAKTFVTVEKYNDVVSSLSDLKDKFKNMNDYLIDMDKKYSGISDRIDDEVAGLTKKLTALEDKMNESSASIKRWVEETLKSYYTSAEVDALVLALNGKLQELSDKLSRLDSIAEDVDKLMERIQSIVFVPRFSDGTAAAWFNRDDDSIEALNDTIDFRIRPKELAAKLARNTQALSLDAVQTITKAGIEKKNIKIEKAFSEDDILSIVFDGSALDASFYNGTSGMSVCLVISDGNNDLSSPYVTLAPMAKSVHVSVQGVSISPAGLDLLVGETSQLSATITPAASSSKVISWSSSDPEVATVDADGLVTAVKEGETIITAAAEGGKTATCHVKVRKTADPIAVESIALDKAELSLVEGGSGTLVASITPSYADNANVTWTSSDETVATVADGVVTAVKEGTAIITVTTEDGARTATCTVTVLPLPQVVVFADKTFEAICLDAFDSDGNGEISFSEAAAADKIYCSGKEITSLEGIEHFTNITLLYCSVNKLTSIDLSHNTKLKELNCYWNDLEVLDLSHNTELQTVKCDSNELTALDLNGLASLTSLNCSTNKLKTLDVSGNTALTSLDVRSNVELSELWMKAGQNIPDLLVDSDVTAIKYKD